MKRTELHALFGGTFDPIHYGHLRPVMALADEIGLDQVSLLPNPIPPHKPQPLASIADRLAMLELAIENLPLFTIDDRELQQQRAAYTINTLRDWRRQNGEHKGLAFIIGQDSLMTLLFWNGWRSLLDYCHILVCPRPNTLNQAPPPPQLEPWLKQHQTTEIAKLHQQQHGYVYLATTPLEAISSTLVREKLANGEDCSALLPPKVLAYIQQHHLYQAD